MCAISPVPGARLPLSRTKEPFVAPSLRCQWLMARAAQRALGSQHRVCVSWCSTDHWAWKAAQKGLLVQGSKVGTPHQTEKMQYEVMPGVFAAEFHHNCRRSPDQAEKTALVALLVVVAVGVENIICH
ncbi:hypothetical protein NDU88_005552 [Pleurodeles waltl]|uniref:Uncharacterized protein n=1 Tax=Pleurodeles waltl TaxID=8319 RepID=A0AAV7TCB3_PLEWA|nr:hypothetical protein NDU88_005552 [Pleurodeles waltl]